MGDSSDGSSSAAQSALKSEKIKQPGIFSRIIDALSPSDNAEEFSENNNANIGSAALAASLGMVNLRRMSVEDVAVPKADIIAVPSDIKKDDLVQVFRDSGLTRIPVFQGTLDTPIGLVHLKDLQILHSNLLAAHPAGQMLSPENS